ncbi:tyrosine-type recombinase/integrase [Desulfitobacterium sp. AusDCA]|uniref:tyrosine-type recombinase/integrase n=1 Tax=Desulfitobacterium sp. AusDCA TaxID=3240383 RepID=UPI003DA73660
MDFWIGQTTGATYVTRLLERGESLKTVQELLGHKDISTTRNTYAHVMPEIKKQAASNLNSMLTRKKLLSKEKLLRNHYLHKLHYKGFYEVYERLRALILLVGATRFELATSTTPR